MVLLDLSDECLEKPLCNFVCAVIILAVAWEVAFNLEVVSHVRSKDSLALLVRNVDVAAENLYLCVLDCREGVNNVAESCNTCCKCAADVCVDECELSCFVVVLVVHVVDCVECVYIQTSKPFKHDVVLVHYFVVVKVFACDWCHFRSNLYAWCKTCFFVLTAVDCVEQSLCKVGACTEELHFLTSLCCRYAAADRVVITPNRAHDVVVLVLDRRCVNRNLCGIVAEVLRQSL